MRPLVVLLTAVAALALALPSGARAPLVAVNVEFSDYRPDVLDVLPGETVNWSNVSTRTHTITSDTGLFDSGDVASGGRFAFTFNEVGTYRYHCTIHPSIVGEVDVRRVTLDSLPTAAIPVETRVEFSGRAAAGVRRVLLQARSGSSAFKTVATVAAGPHGRWSTTVTARASADFRAAAGTDTSEVRRLLVEARRVIVQATPTGLSLTVAPSAPYAPFLVEQYVRERFGWWPIARGAVDYVSEAEVHIRRPARVRVVLVDKDGWTPLATSRVVVLRKR